MIKKITVVFNLAFIVSLNLAPLFGPDSCMESCCKDQKMNCCNMNHKSTCDMNFTDCSETLIFPLVTAPINQVSPTVELVEAPLPLTMTLDLTEMDTQFTLYHYLLPEPPPTHALPLLI